MKKFLLFAALMVALLVVSLVSAPSAQAQTPCTVTPTQNATTGMWVFEIEGDCSPDFVIGLIDAKLNPPPSGGQSTPPQGGGTGACEDAVLVAGPHSYALRQNQDVGDGASHALVYAKNSSGTFVAPIEAGKNLDYETGAMSGEWYLYSGSLGGLECQAKLLAQRYNVTNMFWVGENAPQGWSTVPSATGFVFHVNAPFAVDKVDTGDAVWITNQFSRTDAQTWGDVGGYTTVQGWDGSNAKTVYHFIIEPGYRLSLPTVNVANAPALQGTAWTVTNADPASLLLRFVQMSEEVVTRDAPVSVNRISCGKDTTTFPLGWATQGHGWVCEAIN